MAAAQTRSGRPLLFAWTGNALLALLAIVVAVVWSYAMFFRDYSLSGAVAAEPGAEEPESPYVKEFRQRIEEHSGEITKEAESVAAEVLPPLGEAFSRQAKKDYPRYVATVRQQGEIYLDNVENIFMEKVKGQYRDYLRRHREVLAEEFPDHANKQSLDKLMAEFESVSDNLVERYYLDEFRHETERTTALWDKVQPLPPPKKDQPSLEEQLADYLVDWSVLAFTNEAERRVGVE